VSRTPDPIGVELNLVDLGEDPSTVGGISLNNGSLRGRDSLGVFNLRSGGGGITEAEHQDLDTLVHAIAETSYDEVTRADGRISRVITWTSPAKLLKIREIAIVRDSIGRIAQCVWTQYDYTGAVKETMVETFARSCSSVSSVTRTRTP
jgi:hypothetical protein